MATWSQQDKDEQQPRLPAGATLTYAPDWGWFVQTMPYRCARPEDFTQTAKEAVDYYLAREVPA